MIKPKEGECVRLIGDNECDTHVALVRDCLDIQFTAAYEVQRNDGGWTEVTHFCFYKDHGLTWELMRNA
jgi:hypothetical protein